jgi:NarL family two-component system response regulator LiaR
MTDDDPIRVIVVDDHAVVRNGLKFSLMAYPDLEFAGEAENAEKALELCAEIQPDVVLMDARMPGLDGISATRTIRSLYPGIQVLILTSFQEGSLVHDALQAGAIGYLIKDASMEDLVHAIRTVASGRFYLAPSAGQALAQSVAEASGLGSDLTEREREILALIVQGMGNDQIGAALSISPSTVRFHVSAVLVKLGAANRAEAAALAVKHDLV